MHVKKEDKTVQIVKMGPGLEDRAVMGDVELRFISRMVESLKLKEILTILFCREEPAREFWPRLN